MIKEKKEIINEFNGFVNMDPSELEDWLQTKDSQTSGFFKGEGATESVGHQSGKHIVDILRRNPEKDMNSYTEDDIELMRKAVNYCKRHKAQEQHTMKDTSSRSYKSLKNWGHDSLKAED